MVYNIQCTVCSVQCTLYSVQYTVYSVQRTPLLSNLLSLGKKFNLTENNLILLCYREHVVCKHKDTRVRVCENDSLLPDHRYLFV